MATGTSFERDLATELIYKYKVVVFGKSYCPHTANVKRILTSTYGLLPQDELGSNAPAFEPSSSTAASSNSGEILCFFDIDTDPRVKMIEESREEEGRLSEGNTEDEISRFQDVLAELSDGKTTVPRVFVGGQFIGGDEEVTKLDQNGQLAVLLREAGIELPVPSSSAGARSPEEEAAESGSHHASLTRQKGAVGGGGTSAQPQQPRAR
jgi:glutaredoxin